MCAPASSARATANWWTTQSTSFSSTATPGASEAAARAAYESAGIGPGEIDIVQLQDTEAGHEVMHLAEIGLCRRGEQEALVHDGATERTGRLPTNTDGGLLANGEPIDSSGLRQLFEICRPSCAASPVRTRCRAP